VSQTRLIFTQDFRKIGDIVRKTYELCWQKKKNIE